MKSPASFVSSIFLGVVCVAQLARFVLDVEVVVSQQTVPVVWSLPAGVFTGALSFWLWQERKSSAV